ncbi:hypothetical protein [Fischerella sp. PCC 9605]|uniref:hypothetical protein n=1 Tax=Fischerella sp. PCC 9605 TaxID=1173024 RepID=UPI0012DDB1FE|nr:hypothetical protein [Fischerella sp. PCC 9605]
MLYSKLRSLNTLQQLRRILPVVREFCISSYLLGFSTFFPRPLHRFYSFRSFDCFDGLEQSILPILLSEITANQQKLL